MSEDSEDPLVTSTDGDITIEEDVELEVTGADPITIDSDNSVTIEDDAYVYADGADGRSGIIITSGSDGTVYIADGALYVVEDFVAEDSDNNNRPDDNVAEASDRYGIKILSDTASILNEGVVYVEGQNSYGVWFVDGYNGDFDNTDGTIYVLGENSVGISAQSIDGDLTVSGTVTVVGTGSKALDVSGDVSGSLIIDGTLTKDTSYTTDDGETFSLSRSALREDVAAVTVTGNVAGGILIDAAPYDLDDNDDDEDDDGVDDDDETNGAITASGEDAALLIGGAEDIVIGTVEGRDGGSYSLAVDGTVTASAAYSSFDTVSVEIGGQGGGVDLPGGIGVTGTIASTTVDSQAIALLIHEDVTAPLLYVSGTIKSDISSSGEGVSIAVQDLSGTLATIDNSGHITAEGSAEDTTIALDLRANTTGVTITQYLNDMDADSRADEQEDYEEDPDDSNYDPDNPTVYASITGDIMTGSGDDVLDVSTGAIDGDAYFAAGDDTVLLSEYTNYYGDIHTGTGSFVMSLAENAEYEGTLYAEGEQAQVTISDNATFTGDIDGGGQTTVTVDGGLLQAGADETMEFDHLDVGADGSIGIVFDTEENTVSSFSVNSATFADGATVSVEVTSVAETGGTYTVLTADEIEGADQLELDFDTSTVLYAAELSTDENSITVELNRKTAEQLGLTGPQSAAYEAILAAAVENGYIDQSLIEVEDIAALQEQMDGLLPDYAGGVFDFVTRGSRLAARHISDDSAIFQNWGTGAWVDGLMFNGSKDYTDTLDFKTSGVGISGGLERGLGFGFVGLSLAWAQGSVKSGTEDNPQDIDASTLEVAAHWRNRAGPLYAFARVSGIRASLSSTRTYTGTIDDEEFSYSSAGDWSGIAASAMVGASYNFDLSENFTLRPKGVLDAYWLKEDGYEEEADTDTIELTVEERTSKAISATASLVASYRLGRRRADSTPLTFELEAGRREALAGSLGKTTANFVDGDSFTLVPGSLASGWTAEARLLAGGWYHTWQLGVGAEKSQGDIDLSARATISVAF